jgi:hypothetical protein
MDYSRGDMLKIRLVELLGRHTRDEDKSLSDRDFILKVFERYQKYLREEIVDVGE